MDEVRLCQGEPAPPHYASRAAFGSVAIHRVREILIKQRTMLINTLRGLMAEFGIVVAEGPHHVGELVTILADPVDRRIPTPETRRSPW